MSLDVSVVMATFNRLDLLERLLRQLSAQTLDPRRFEVVVVDDGSKEPVAPRVDAARYPFALTVVTQANAGAAAARHRGLTEAKAELVVITDDDMQVPPHFLQAHLAAHPPGSRRAVMGRIKADPDIGEMPYFERWYAFRLDKLARHAAEGSLRLDGSFLYTGNLSLRRADYFAVGGFDPSLKRSEDAELGLKLERAGVELAFTGEAYTLHGSDHTSEVVWLKRAFLYGVFDSRIGAKHDDLLQASPWRLLFTARTPVRPFIAAAALLPRATKPLSQLALAVTRAADRAGLDTATFAGSSLVYSMEYMRGVREEAGSLASALRAAARYVKRRRTQT